MRIGRFFYNLNTMPSGLKSTTVGIGTLSAVLTNVYTGTSTARSELLATVNGTADFRQTFGYENGRLAETAQSSQEGGAAVASKRIAFDRDRDGRITGIRRYQVNGTSEILAVESSLEYDSNGLLTVLTHFQTNETVGSDGVAVENQNVLAFYWWSYDTGYSAVESGGSGSAAGPQTLGLGHLVVPNTRFSRLGRSDATVRLSSSESKDGTAYFGHDATGQLTSAEYTGVDGQTAPLANESYTFDATGNRIDSGWETGAKNHLLFDGIYHYSYDFEGNRTAKYIDVNHNGELDAGDNDITEYTWDFRNRLTKVTARAQQGGPATKVVEYVFDVDDRWIGRRIDADGDGPGGWTRENFIYDGSQIVLQLSDESGTTQVTHRYLWSDGVDQLLADEQVAAGGESQIVWTLTDHQGTVRDLAVYQPAADPTATGTTSVFTHRVYTSFGQLVSETHPVAAATTTCLIGYTGRPFDNKTGLQNNLFRWYDPTTQRWASEDPIDLAAGQVNTTAYVNNSPLVATDPSGLAKFAMPPSHSEVAKEAAEIVGYSFGKRERRRSFFFGLPTKPFVRGRDYQFVRGLMNGATWNDEPEGFVAWVIDYFCDEYGNDTVTRSHNHGPEEYMHMMVPHCDNLFHGVGKRPGAELNLLSDVAYANVPKYQIQQFGKELRDFVTKTVTAAGESDSQRTKGFELGKILHTIYDSYVPSHAVRENPDAKLPGRIVQIQNYALQDSDKHVAAEVPRGPNDKGGQRAREAAKTMSVKFLEKYKLMTEDGAAWNEEKTRDLVNWLFGSEGPFQFAPGVKLGGTLERFRNPKAEWDRRDKFEIPEGAISVRNREETEDLSYDNPRDDTDPPVYTARYYVPGMGFVRPPTHAEKARRDREEERIASGGCDPN